LRFRFIYHAVFAIETRLKVAKQMKRILLLAFVLSLLHSVPANADGFNPCGRGGLLWFQNCNVPPPPVRPIGPHPQSSGNAPGAGGGIVTETDCTIFGVVEC
jgi:hypothetical protein